MGCEDKNRTCCLADVLRKILALQKQDFDNESYSGCDKPFLGPVCSSVCYNTRPITLYNCCTGTQWSFPYTLNGESRQSTVFRIEALDDCCCTCRILYPNSTNDGYVSTNQFFTLDLGCVSALQCLADTYVELC